MSLLVSYTLFHDLYPKDSVDKTDIEWPALVERVKNPPEYPNKKQCPLISMAEYGDKRSIKGYIRHGENVRRIFGVEFDYDGEKVSLAEAAAWLRAERIQGVLYTSPSHTAERPRWRGLFPLSEPEIPEKRAQYVGRINRILGGIGSNESFALSQSFFIGRVTGREYEVLELEGTCIDLMSQIEPLFPASHDEFNRDGRSNDELRESFNKGEGRYDSMMKLSARWAARGMEYDDICAALEALLEKGNSHNADGVDLIERIHPLAESAVRKFGGKHKMNGHASKPVPVAVAPPATKTPDKDPRWNPNDQFRDIPAILSFVRMSEVKAEKIIPVWPGVLYKGKVTLIAGVPGDGKSLMSCDIAARASVGGPLPCGAGHFNKMKVAFITAEDDPADTIRPRLDVAGANVDDILLIKGKYTTDKDGVRHLDQISLLEDLGLLELLIEAQGIRLMIIDPLTSFSSGDTNKTQESRRLLDAVAQMAARQSLSVLVITHMNKRGDAKTAMQLVAGSHVLVAAVRIALAMARDPNDASRRLLLGLKVNIDAETGGFAFKVEVKEHDEVGEVPVTVWEQFRVTNMTAQDVLIDSTPKAQANVERTMEIQEWLKERFARGAVLATDIFEQAEDMNYPVPKVRLALKHMGAWWERRGYKGPVYWSIEKKS